MHSSLLNTFINNHYQWISVDDEIDAEESSGDDEPVVAIVVKRKAIKPATSSQNGFAFEFDDGEVSWFNF